MIKSKNSIKCKINTPQKIEAKLNASIIYVEPDLEELEVMPSKEEQRFVPEKDGYSNVIVKGDESLTPNNIIKGVKIFDVTGELDIVDTSDATATAKDIAKDKTAYVNGEKIIGEYENKLAVNNPIKISDVSGTIQVEFEGKNLFNEKYYKSSSLYESSTYYFSYVQMPNNFKTKFYGNMFLKGKEQNLVVGFSDVRNGVAERMLNKGTLTENVEYDFTNAENVYFIIGNPDRMDNARDINLIFNNYNIMVTKEEDTEYAVFKDEKTYTFDIDNGDKFTISLS